MTTATPHAVSNAFTIEDLEALPDDGNRHELIGGAIVTTPAPEPVHQRILRKLARLVEEGCSKGYEVFFAPIDFDLSEDQRMEPDLIVVPDASVGQKRLTGPALLVVEIVSPGTRTNDMVTKRAVYAEAGVPAYWIVDPSSGHLLALRLDEERHEYEPYADTTGHASLDWPLRVSLDVGELARR